MTLTYRQMIPAYKALMGLANKTLPLPTAWALHKIKTAVQSHVDFYCAEERKAVEECGGTIAQGGNITFERAEDAEKFTKKADELNQMEIDIDIHPAEINLETMSDVQISVNDLAALSCFLKETD